MMLETIRHDQAENEINERRIKIILFGIHVQLKSNLVPSSYKLELMDLRRILLSRYQH